MMATNPPPDPPSVGATYAEVLDRLKTVSTRMTDILRTLGIGTVVFCWGLFTAEKGLAQDVAIHHRRWIVITAAIAVLGILFDLLQAVVSYWVANRLRSQMEKADLSRAPYPYDDLLYRSQTFFFVGKSILMPLATGSIIILLFVMVWNPQPVAPAAMSGCCCPGNSVSAPPPALPSPGK